MLTSVKLPPLLNFDARGVLGVCLKLLRCKTGILAIGV